jgi:surface antigen
MAHRFCSIYGCLAASLGMACVGASSTDDVVESVGLTTSALSVCNETVPANRNVDGIPAYAQCADSNSAAIYSNNGVDTATTQMSKDWVRTQWSGGYQCTEFAHRYLHFKWGVEWIPNGNAGMWCESQPPANSGLVQTMTPVHGDIMVLAPGSCGADATTGHVNIVDQVNGTKLVNVEQNGARRGNYMLSCAKCFLHVMKNDGSGSPATGAAAGAAAPSAPGGVAPSLPAAGAAAPSSGRPQRPDMGRPAAAGAAAPGIPGSATAAAGSGAATTRPTLQPPTAAAPTTTPSAPLASTSAAAGSSATAPLAGAVTASPSTTTSAPAEAGCSVAAVGGKHTAGMPITFALSLLGGMVLRSRRRG